MFQFIWQNWRRHKERFLLLIIGVLIISAGLSYLVGLIQSNKGTVVDNLQEEWSASYDIAVRPSDTRSITEDKDLLEPNYLSGIAGGISLDQYDTIQDLDEIDVAAPISMIGYMPHSVTLEDLDLDEGIYQLKESTVTDTGANKKKADEQTYFSVGSPIEIGEIKDDEIVGEDMGLRHFDPELTVSLKILLAGIDPKEEAKLAELDEAVSDRGSSRYFQEEDDSHTQTHEIYNGGEYQVTRLPIIAADKELIDKTYTFQIDKLDIPFNDTEEKRDTYDMLKKKGGEDYLKTVETTDSETYTYDMEDGYDRFLKGVLGVDLESTESSTNSDTGGQTILMEKPSPISYKTVSSPYPDQWPYAYEAVPFEGEALEENPDYHDVFRPIDLLGRQDINEDGPMPPRVEPDWIGFFDPGKLNISQDPLNELPMETYRPASADLVLDQDKQPINPPKKLKPTDQPFGFLTKPPQMLTTIDAASGILGDDPISAIRVKVAGVDDLSEESQATLEDVADDIENKTGLTTDITLGSSPQPTLTHIPETKNSDEVGWIEQPWVKLGSTFTIFDETKIGFSGVIASVIAVAIVYVFTTNIVSLLARRKEFAILLAVGWRPAQLSKMIFYESGLLGAFASVMALTMLGIVHVTQGTETSLPRVVLVGIFGLIIYGLGAIIPAYLARRITPFEAIQSGEMTKSARRLTKTQGVTSMAISYLFGKFQRTLLSIIAIALPTSLLSFFIFISFRLKGVMFTTWLGQYTALEVGPSHYWAMGIAFLIAILTTAEIMWHNVTERKPEIALLKAIGWRNGTVRKLIITEGIYTGVLAGLLGIIIAIGMIWGMYQQFPLEHIGFLLATGIVPIFAGLLGSMPPAEKAVRVAPSYGIKE